MISRVSTAKKPHAARRILLMLSVLLLAGWHFGGLQTAYAVEAHIDVQPASVEEGQAVEVTIAFQGDQVGRIRAIVEYDKSVLSYQGDEGDTGVIDLTMAGTGDGIIHTLTFEAVGPGTCALTLTPMDAYDLDEMGIPLPEQQNVSISVSEKPQTDMPEDKKEEVDTQEQGGNHPTDDQKSEDREKEDQKQAHRERFGAAVWILLPTTAVLAAVLAAVVIKRRTH